MFASTSACLCIIRRHFQSSSKGFSSRIVFQQRSSLAENEMLHDLRIRCVLRFGEKDVN